MPYATSKKTGKLEYVNPNKPLDRKRYDAISGQTNEAPVYKTPGGESYTGVKNEKGSYVNPQDEITAEAERRIAAQNREKQIQDIMTSKQAPASQAETDLAKKQSQEISQIDALKSSAPQLSVPERNVQAGKAFMNSVAQTLGVSQEKINEKNALKNDNFASNILNTIIGKATTLGGRWGSISNLFSKSNQGNIKNLQGDVSDMVSESTRISRAATSKGANVQQAIKSLSMLEEGVRQRYLDANIALDASPQDRAEGLDFTDDMSRDLRVIVEQKQALERYQLTGDVNQVLNLVGTTQEVSQ